MNPADDEQQPAAPILGEWRPLPMPVKPRLADRARAVALWARDTGLGITGFVVVLIVALAGWTASFIGLHQFGMVHMDFTSSEAWLVPVTFDGAAAGLSLVVFRASIHGRSAPLWRLLIIAFTALSSWINFVHIDDLTGRWIACYMPPSAVILFEGLMSEARAAFARREGGERPRVHPLRWIFDRKGTKAIYRAYVLGIELPEPLQQAATNLAANPVPEPVPNYDEEAGEPAAEPASEPPVNPGSEPAEPEVQERPEPPKKTPRTSVRRTGRTSPRTGADQPNRQVREPAEPNETPSPAEQVRQVLNLIEEHGYDTVNLGFVMDHTGMKKTTAYNRLVEARATWSEDQD